MRRHLPLALVLATAIGSGSEMVWACGDKMLPIGAGTSFQRGYAAIHPASILIVLPPKSVKEAAVRDSRLVKELKKAGHRVEVVKSSAKLTEILGRSPYAIVLADRADVSTIQAAAAGSGRPAPSIIAVVEEPSPADLAQLRQQTEYVFLAPQPLRTILNLLDDVMTVRLDRSRGAAPGL